MRLILTDMANDRRIRNYYSYDAFGESVMSHEDIHNRFRFNGEQYDPVTSQYYLRARFYNPIIGRFTQEDTYYGDGLNLYEYCRNNPVLYRDPSGHDAVNQGNLYRNILNVGAGDNPIPCATNIDIDPRVSGVMFGDVYDLSQFTSGQFDHVIALNPYKYSIFESDVPRVLKDGGVMTVTGNYSNKYFKEIYNASPEMLKTARFEMVSKGGAASIFEKYGGKVTNGTRSTMGKPLQIILKKVGG